jgi:DNA polymerase-3 subunit alpha
MRHFSTATTADVADLAHDAEVVIGGLIKSVRILITKTGKSAGSKMAIFDLEDLAGTVGCVIFPRDFQKFQDLVQPDRVVFVRGTIDRQREEPQVRTSEVLSFEDGRRRLARAVVIRLHESALNGELLTALHAVLVTHPGPLPLYIELEDASGGRTLIRAADDFHLAMDDALREDLDNLLGSGHVVLAANDQGRMVKV